jgi:hypothetical protein
MPVPRAGSFGLALDLVVKRAKIQSHQRHPEAAGDGLGGEALAAALHAQQQHALGRIEPGREGRAGKTVAALADPLLEAQQAGDVGKARGVVFEMQAPALVEQLEFQLGQFRQVGGADRTVAHDQLAGDAARVGQR